MPTAQKAGYLVMLDRNNPDMAALMDALLDSRDLRRIVALAATVVCNPVTVIDSGYNLLAWSHYDSVPDDTWHQRIDEGYWDYDFVARVRQFMEKIGPTPRRSAIVTGLSPLRRRIDVLYANGALVGYSVVLELENNLEDTDDETYAFVSRVLSRSLVAERAYYVHRGREDSISFMLRDLLSMRFPNKVLFEERIRGSEFDRDTVFRLFCLGLDGYAPAEDGGEKLKNAVKRLLPYSWSAYDNDNIIVLMDHTATLEHAPAALGGFEAFLRDNGLLAGQSTLFKDLFLLPEQKRQAATALAFLRDKRPAFLFAKDDIMASYEGCKIPDMLDHLPVESLAGFCHSAISAMAAHDREHNTDYLRTVFAYLDAKQSSHNAAKRLFVHHNTVNYRLGRARELFDLDFSTEYENLHYYLSCIIVLYYL